MNNEYIIVNKTAIQKRIEELERQIKESSIEETGEYDFQCEDKIEELNWVLSQSTPLITELAEAIQFGKDIRSEKSFINNNFGIQFLDYEDSTEETNNYISTLKLNI